MIPDDFTTMHQEHTMDPMHVFLHTSLERIPFGVVMALDPYIQKSICCSDFCNSQKGRQIVPTPCGSILHTPRVSQVPYIANKPNLVDFTFFVVFPNIFSMSPFKGPLNSYLNITPDYLASSGASSVTQYLHLKIVMHRNDSL